MADSKLKSRICWQCLWRSYIYAKSPIDFWFSIVDALYQIFGAVVFKIFWIGARRSERQNALKYNALLPVGLNVEFGHQMGRILSPNARAILGTRLDTSDGWESRCQNEFLRSAWHLPLHFAEVENFLPLISWYSNHCGANDHNGFRLFLPHQSRIFLNWAESYGLSNIYQNIYNGKHLTWKLRNLWLFSHLSRYKKLMYCNQRTASNLSPVRWKSLRQDARPIWIRVANG